MCSPSSRRTATATARCSPRARPSRAVRPGSASSTSARRMELRQAGITVPILTWLHDPDEAFAAAVEHGIDVGVSIDRAGGCRGIHRRDRAPQGRHRPQPQWSRRDRVAGVLRCRRPPPGGRPAGRAGSVEPPRQHRCGCRAGRGVPPRARHGPRRRSRPGGAAPRRDERCSDAAGVAAHAWCGSALRCTGSAWMATCSGCSVGRCARRWSWLRPSRR